MSMLWTMGEMYFCKGLLEGTTRRGERIKAVNASEVNIVVLGCMRAIKLLECG
jgi:hypothetical protein